MFDTIEQLRKLKTYSHYDYMFKIAAHSYFDGDNKWAIRLKAQGIAESGLTMTANSAKGAYGVMQVMPATMKWLSRGRMDVADPYANVMVGSALMAYLMGRKIAIKDQNGNIIGVIMDGFEPLNVVQDETERWKFALAGYNCGIGHITGRKNGDYCWRMLRSIGQDITKWENVKKVLRHITGPANAEQTINYVDRVINYSKLMEDANEQIV